MDDQVKKQVKVTERKRMNTDSVNSLTNFENSSAVYGVSGYERLTLEEGLRGGDRTGQDKTISQESGTENVIGLFSGPSPPPPTAKIIILHSVV